MIESLLATWIPQGILWHWMLLYSVVMGLAVGSFLNVCIDRLPLQSLSSNQKQQILSDSAISDEVKHTIIADRLSLATPSRSLCFACGVPLPWYDNIPVFSYLWLRGRCRQCGQPYGPRAFWIELSNGTVYGLLYWALGLSSLSVLLAGNISFGLVYFGILLETGKVSQKLLYSALLLVTVNLGLLGTRLAWT